MLVCACHMISMWSQSMATTETVTKTLRQILTGLNYLHMLTQTVIDKDILWAVTKSHWNLPKDILLCMTSTASPPPFLDTSPTRCMRMIWLFGAPQSTSHKQPTESRRAPTRASSGPMTGGRSVESRPLPLSSACRPRKRPLRSDSEIQSCHR